MDYSRGSSSRRNYHNKKKSDNEWLHTLLFYILPFLVFNFIIFYCVTSRPKVVVALEDTNDYLTTEATVTIKSWFPTKKVQFSMDNEPLEAVKGKKRTYTLSVMKNGVIEAYVENINGMSTTIFEQVNILDDNPPAIENAHVEDGIVTLTVSDSQSGVNPDSVYALDSGSNQIAPLSVDRATATWTFEMDSAGLHVYAQDNAGNEVQGTFTSHKEGGVETLEGGVSEPQENQTPESEVSIQ